MVLLMDWQMDWQRGLHWDWQKGQQMGQLRDWQMVKHLDLQRG